MEETSERAIQESKPLISASIVIRSWLRERHLICLWHCALECIAASMDIRGAETLWTDPGL